MPVTARFQPDKLKETNKANKQLSLSEKKKKGNLNRQIFCFCVGLWLQGAKPLNRGLTGTYIVFLFREKLRRTLKAKFLDQERNTKNPLLYHELRA